MAQARGQSRDSRRAVLLGLAVVLWPLAGVAVAGMFLSGLALAVAVAAVSGLGLAGIVVVLRAIACRRTVASIVADEGGGAMLEFVMVLPIALMLVLLMIQSSLLMVGNVCVNYAAYCAARAAVVTVPQYAGVEEPHNVVGLSPTAKTERIRRAAVWAVTPVSCSSPDLPPRDAELNAPLANLFDEYAATPPTWIGNIISRKREYADRYTSIELAAPANGAVYADNENLAVTVQHTFYLAVPYAGWLFAKMDSDNRENLDFGAGELGLVIRAKQVLTNEGVADFVAPDTFE
ncbi:MAG: pilus assembly protein [Planctomycetaceae bacterium]|nr:pilus assembly protein [Planctomycetaceae bacterium]